MANEQTLQTTVKSCRNCIHTMVCFKKLDLSDFSQDNKLDIHQYHKMTDILIDLLKTVKTR
ncbi:MAG: hypothetical protein JXR68_12995 [Bacteroidales bacterium]|nr:hypothetical protein [Bacteroidales bacterium]